MQHFFYHKGGGGCMLLSYQLQCSIMLQYKNSVLWHIDSIQNDSALLTHADHGAYPRGCPLPRNGAKICSVYIYIYKKAVFLLVPVHNWSLTMADASKYYERLRGEIFRGSYIGDFSRGDPESAFCYKIEIDAMTANMKALLNKIKRNYEGKVWKGFHDGVVYIREADHHPSITDGEEFRIIDYKLFEFDPKEFKEPWKYSECCCYYLVLEVV